MWALCILGQKRNKDSPIELLKHFWGEKSLSKEHNTRVQSVKPCIEDNLGTR